MNGRLQQTKLDALAAPSSILWPNWRLGGTLEWVFRDTATQPQGNNHLEAPVSLQVKTQLSEMPVYSRPRINTWRGGAGVRAIYTEAGAAVPGYGSSGALLASLSLSFPFAGPGDHGGSAAG